MMEIIMSIEKRLLKLLREEVENYGLTPHIRRVLEEDEYVAKQGGDKPDVSVEEFNNFMNGGEEWNKLNIKNGL
jgi:hypothetical protein